MSGDNNTKELPIISELEALSLRAGTVESLAAISRRKVEDIRTTISQNSIQPVAKLKGLAEEDAPVYDINTVRASFEASGLQFLKPMVPDLSRRKQFDLGGGRTAVVKVAGHATITKIKQVYGIDLERSRADVERFNVACVAWGIESMKPEMPGIKKQGTFWPDELIDHLDPLVIHEIASFVASGAFVEPAVVKP